MTNGTKVLAWTALIVGLPAAVFWGIRRADDVDVGGPAGLATGAGGRALITGCTASILGNHGTSPHRLTAVGVDLADLIERLSTWEAGDVNVTLGDGGPDTHRHAAVLKPAQIRKVRAGKSVNVKTTDAFGHTHTLRLGCKGVRRFGLAL